MCSGVLLHTSSFRNQRRGTRIYKVAVNIYVAGSRGLTSAINVKKKKKAAGFTVFQAAHSIHSKTSKRKKEVHSRPLVLQFVSSDDPSMLKPMRSKCILVYRV